MTDPNRMAEIENKRKQIIEHYAKVVISLDENNADALKATIIEADVTAMMSAANTYLEMRESASPMSKMYQYLTEAAGVYSRKSTEVLQDEVFKRLGIKK